MDCFVSAKQFSDFEFLLQHMFYIQDHSVQKNICDGVYFSKVTSLSFTVCNSTIQRLYHIYFLEHVPEINCLKKNILRKKSIVYQHLNKVTILPKRELTLDLLEEALKI